MNKLILATLLTLSFSALATKYDDDVKPKDSSSYVAEDRFVSTKMRGSLEYIVTDTKTGCQYMVVENGGYARPATPLGCFEEYKKK